LERFDDFDLISYHILGPLTFTALLYRLPALKKNPVRFTAAIKKGDYDFLRGEVSESV